MSRWRSGFSSRSDLDAACVLFRRPSDSSPRLLPPFNPPTRVDFRTRGTRELKRHPSSFLVGLSPTWEEAPVLRAGRVGFSGRRTGGVVVGRPPCRGSRRRGRTRPKVGSQGVIRTRSYTYVSRKGLGKDQGRTGVCPRNCPSIFSRLETTPRNSVMTWRDSGGDYLSDYLLPRPLQEGVPLVSSLSLRSGLLFPDLTGLDRNRRE